MSLDGAGSEPLASRCEYEQSPDDPRLFVWATLVSSTVNDEETAGQHGSIKLKIIDDTSKIYYVCISMQCMCASGLFEI